VDVAAGKLLASEIDEAHIAARLTLAGIPDPDLLIRTGGEQRISNFLLWNLAYTEIYFSDVLWPEFGAANLDAAFDFFARRERRFGKTSAQVTANANA
jgi:undecaprenyl diphosphate synthase